MLNVRKLFCVIGGVITFISTYLMSFWYEGSNYYGWGIGFIQQLPDIFSKPPIYGLIGIPEYMVFIVALILIIFLLSGILQLCGVVNRGAAVIGSILPILLGVYLVLNVYAVLPPDISIYSVFLIGESFGGTLPLHIGLSDVGLGTYTLIIGGTFSLIGGIRSPIEHK